MDQRVRPGPESKPELPSTGVSYLELLRQKHADQARATLGGINFRHANTDNKEDKNRV